MTEKKQWNPLGNLAIAVLALVMIAINLTWATPNTNSVAVSAIMGFASGANFMAWISTRWPD